MKKFILGVTFGFLISIACAERFPSPPPLTKENIVALQNYLRTIYDHQANYEIVTSSPDGSRSGQRGDRVFLISGATYQEWVNINGSTNWASSNFTD